MTGVQTCALPISRLAFLKLMMTGANFLILDEPTNHLDIPAKEAVEEALMAFPGTFLVVSHDRYFLDKVTNRTLALENGVLTEYIGNYSDYQRKKATEEEETAKTPPAPQEKTAAVSSVRKNEGSREAPPFLGLSEEKRQELLRRAEAEIAMAEAELRLLEREMNDPTQQSDPEKSAAIAAAYAAKEQEIEQRYEKWGALSGEG